LWGWSANARHTLGTWNRRVMSGFMTDLSEADISAIIEMALSDHTAFADIEREYG